MDSDDDTNNHDNNKTNTHDDDNNKIIATQHNTAFHLNSVERERMRCSIATTATVPQLMRMLVTTQACCLKWARV